MYVHGAGQDKYVSTPNILKKLISTKYHIRVFGKEKQQFEFLLGKGDGFPDFSIV